MKTPEKRTIVDDFGQPWEYYFAPLRAGQGVRLWRKFIAKATPLIEKISPALANLNLDGEGDEDRDFNPADFAFIGEGAEIIADLLAESGDEQLFKDLFGDSYKTNPADARQTYKLGSEFDFAFQCSYGELVRAAVEAFKINFGPAIKHYFSGNLKGAKSPQTQK